MAQDNDTCPVCYHYLDCTCGYNYAWLALRGARPKCSFCGSAMCDEGKCAYLQSSNGEPRK